ncbi:MAG: transcriptional regulator MraZ [Rhodospirillaceae bacterium]|nr:MAG: transcriptional regulator MraZ [Rhodospirillaceae bacterium]
MALFLSTYTNKIDKKGRVSVPASFRAAIGGQSFHGIVAFRSYRMKTIEAFSIDRMERLSTSLDALDLFSDAQDDLAATIFADSRPLPFDSEGRILLPPEFTDYANLQGQAAFVGRGATFQIWEPKAFEAHQMSARKRALERGTTLRLGPSDGPGGD